MAHTCQAIVVTCIDFRLQHFIHEWVEQNFNEGRFDRVALAGGVFDYETVFNQIKISKRLHEIKEVILINHEDCGAYGEAGTFQKHKYDLDSTAEKISHEMPDLKIRTFYLHLDGTFEETSKI